MSHQMNAVHATSNLTELVSTRGIDADRVSLLRLANEAADQGVSPVLIDVMTDEQAPPPARMRAYGRVSSRYCALVADRSPSRRERVLLSA